MSESNAIATINSTEGFQRLAQFSTSAAAKELAGFNMRFDRVKVPSGGGLTFMLQEPDANGNTDFREINAVILTHHPMQSYFQGKYTGGNARPECSSMDGSFGVGSPGGNCARCYLNQFGTAENNSKACKRKHRIYILKEGDNLSNHSRPPYAFCRRLWKIPAQALDRWQRPGCYRDAVCA